MIHPGLALSAKVSVIALAVLLTSMSCVAAPACAPYRSLVTREAHLVNGLNAPVPMYMAQAEQESGCRPGITAGDGGMGIAQFMPPTAAQIYRLYPEIGKPEPYNPTWAIPALIRYDAWIAARVKGSDDCQRYGAALHGYNAGLGYSQQKQRASSDPLTWFGVTEYIPTHQSAHNAEYSRMYARWVLMKRQPAYRTWGNYVCDGVQP